MPPPPKIDPLTGAVPQTPATTDQLAGRGDPRRQLVTLDSLTALPGKGKTRIAVMLVIQLRF